MHKGSTVYVFWDFVRPAGHGVWGLGHGVWGLGHGVWLVRGHTVSHSLTWRVGTQTVRSCLQVIELSGLVNAKRRRTSRV